MKDPVQHTVVLQQLLTQYQRVTASTFNPDVAKAKSLLIKMAAQCVLALEAWTDEEKK